MKTKSSPIKSNDRNTTNSNLLKHPLSRALQALGELFSC